jgi:hypothetical protein
MLTPEDAVQLDKPYQQFLAQSLKFPAAPRAEIAAIAAL